MTGQIRFIAGQRLPAIGQGTWYMGEKAFSAPGRKTPLDRV